MSQGIFQCTSQSGVNTAFLVGNVIFRNHFFLHAYALSAPIWEGDACVRCTIVSSKLNATIVNHIAKQVMWYVMSTNDVMLTSQSDIT